MKRNKCSASRNTWSTSMEDSGFHPRNNCIKRVQSGAPLELCDKHWREQPYLGNWKPGNLDSGFGRSQVGRWSAFLGTIYRIEVEKVQSWKMWKWDITSELRDTLARAGSLGKSKQPPSSVRPSVHTTQGKKKRTCHEFEFETRPSVLSARRAIIHFSYRIKKSKVTLGPLCTSSGY